MLGALPLVALYFIFLNVVHGGQVTDFENAFYPAAEAVLHGRSPYPAVDDPSLVAGTAYVYPPLTAIVTIPLTTLSSEAAGSRRHGAPGGDGDRDAPRSRRARLALLRDGVPLAPGDLGDPGGERDDPARARGGARVAIPRARRRSPV